MTRFSTAIALALPLFFVGPSAFAQSGPVGGVAAYIPGTADTLRLADGRMLVQGTTHTVLIEDDPESPIHLMSQDCGGTTLIDADGMPVHLVGSCAAIDEDGDFFYISYLNTTEGGDWSYTGGTGKFADIEGGGTSEVLAIGPDGRTTIRYTGRIDM